jgi:cytochrome c biogenesis protein
MADKFEKAYDWTMRAFSSLRLAVLLLIVLAAVSIFGTFIPQDQQPQFYIQKYGVDVYHDLKLLGLIDLYHSWGFRLVTSLLTLNLVVCSIRRMKGIVRRTFNPTVVRSAESIKALPIFNELPPGRADVLERALVEKRFRIRKTGAIIYGSKGVIGLWGDVVTHISILLILLGALVGSLGFVGTVNVYEGDWTDQYYDWNKGKDEPFGFSLYVDKFTLEHYPTTLRITVRRRGTGQMTGVFETKEGKAFTIPGTDYKVIPVGVDYDKQEALLKIYKGDDLDGVYETGAPDGGTQAPTNFDYTFSLASFSEPILKSVSSGVRIVKDGREQERGTVEINSPLKYGDLTIYQISYARDGAGRFYSGFQIVRDPGLPLVYAGFVLLLAGLFFSFYFYHRQVWICVEEDRILVGGSSNKDIVGFMREYSGVVKRFLQEVEP